MDSEYKLYLSRAQNELNLSNIIIKISNNKDLQISLFEIKPDTYYSASIAHAYYSIFYAAKAYLFLKNVKTKAPEEHKKTFEEFSKFVNKGIIDVELLKIYKNILIKADSLLFIFEYEKGKRSNFTYKKLPQANYEPAKESINNAQIFFNHIFNLCEKY
ncbi:MAG: HEPN domain-containing protein [Candidatus Nanoarchaeia archaeon]|nr:HEPN domain-containing protein [Candidatus Nanoarchaeia archaeon]